MPIPLYPGSPVLTITPIKVPVTPKGALNRSILFDKAGSDAGNYSSTLGTMWVLPNQGRLFGLVLNPKFDHYHNFISFKGGNPPDPTLYNNGILQDNILLDQRGIVKKEITDNANMVKWFTWEATTPLAEVIESEETAEVDETDEDASVSPSSPKWTYLWMNVPEEDYGTNNSGILPENNSARNNVLIPFQGQKNSHNNTSGTIHWGIKRLMSLPFRGSFYIDIWVPKSVDFKTSNTPSETNGNGDAYFKKLVDQSYIVIDMKKDDENYYRLEISTLSENAKFYQMVNNATKDGNSNGNGGTAEVNYTAVLLSEMSGHSALTLLQGDKDGKLRITVQNIMNNFIISTNLAGNEHWVINKPYREPTKDDSEEEVSSEVDAQLDAGYMSTGGELFVYGGNISAGVSFCHLNYTAQSEVVLSDFKAIGEGRKGNTYFYMGGDGARVANGKIPSKLLVDDKYYRSMAGFVDGVNLGSRPDIRVGDNSTIVSSDVILPSAGPYETQMRTTISLKSSIIKHIDLDFSLGYATTPTLQYCRQEFEKDVTQVTSVGEFPCSRISSLDLERSVDGYHTASTTGSMSFNALDDQPGVEGLDGLTNAIAKSTYIKIDADYGNGAFKGDGGTIFTGMATNSSDETRAGQRTLTYELSDYWRILDGSVVQNSPYFDGEAVDLVVKYWIDYCGFVDANIAIRPSNKHMGVSFDFDAPQTKFKDKESVSGVIKNLSKKYNSISYFDSLGRFVFRKQPSIVTGGSSAVASAHFSSAHEFVNKNIKPFGPYSGNSGTGSSDDPFIAYQVRNMKWNVNDIVNQIILITVDAGTRDYVVVADMNVPSLTDPNYEGFIGYQKPFVQEEAMFGGYAEAKAVLREYTKMYRPPYTVDWTTFGGSASIEVDMLDLVKIDGMDVIVQKISNKFNAENKTWDTEWSGEWIYPPGNNITNTSGGSV
jgi:hypothetical protein